MILKFEKKDKNTYTGQQLKLVYPPLVKQRRKEQTDGLVDHHSSNVRFITYLK